MQIGDILTHSGRRYVVRGCDPVGVSPRVIYLEAVETGVRSVVQFQDLHTKRGGGRLRIGTEPRANELPKHP